MAGPSRQYWVLVAVLVAFGIVTGFSVGLPFLLVGLTLAVVAGYRDRPAVFWPPVVAVLAFLAGFVIVAPLTCEGTDGADAAIAITTVCSSIVGIDYSGSGNYNPSPLPALVVGLTAAIVLGTLTRLVLATNGRNQRSRLGGRRTLGVACSGRSR